jgi:hypothetical protein
MKRTFSLFSLVFVVFITFLGCGAGVQGQPLTPVEISQNGTHHFAATPDRAFEASVAALKAQGYEIASADRRKGTITTAPKLVRATAQRVAPGTALATEAYRRYRLSVSSDGKGAKIVAEPSVFIGSRDISADPVWDIEGQMGERVLWAQLFREIQSGL